MRAVVLRLSAAGVAVIFAAWACLPDLEISAAAPSCGDGIIDPEAGEQCDPGPDAAVDGSVCSSCLVTCSSGAPFVDPASHHCYFSPLPSATDVNGSVAGCEANAAHVVRFVSQGEVSLVEAHASSPPFWVGLELHAGTTSTSWLPLEPTPEPGWDPNCSGCFANVEAGAEQIPYPTKATDRGPCVSGWQAGQSWLENLCALERSTICEREPIGTRVHSCPQGDCFTVAATQATKSYFLVPSRRLGANDAAQLCKTSGGRLVIFQSGEEREQVGHELASLAADFWIGMASDTNGNWTWDIAKAGLEPLPWGESQPTLEGGARAYVQITPGAVDSELARAGNAADAGSEQHYVVCEL